jgi:2-keto-4-pentenoate hydratase/2-oxohepta-3-ene-1,7-dioic acid hydratase in catechol pathway
VSDLTIRFLENGKEKAGVILEDKYFDVSSFGEDYNEIFFENNGLDRLQDFIKKNKTQLKDIPKFVTLFSPFARPSKIGCIGLNYADHAKESGAELPLEPVLFLKSTTAVCGANDNIIIPKDSKKLIGKWNLP